MKYFRLIIVPEGSDSPRQLRVSNRFVLFGLIFAACFVLLNVALVGWNLRHLGDSVQMAHFRKERDQLESQVTLVRQRLDSLAFELAVLSERNRTLYVSTGIPEPEHGYAVGGPQIAGIAKNSPLAKAKFSIDSLLFVARQEASALKLAEKELEKRKKILRHTPSIWPMRGFVSSGFGKRLDPITGEWRMHEGIDICAPKGTPVYAAADGRVKSVGWKQQGFGKMVIVDHIWYETRYAHLDGYTVVPGQKIKRGEQVGTCGRTGRTTGVHLHYEVRVAGKPVNPKDYLLPLTICVD